MAIIKILLIGPQNTGKTTMAKILIKNLSVKQNFNHVAIDDFRSPDQDIHAEYASKLNFVAKATKNHNAIIECSGFGLTASILLSKIRDLIENIPTHVFVFYLDNELSLPNPKHATVTFREFSPTIIQWSNNTSRFKIIKRTLSHIL